MPKNNNTVDRIQTIWNMIGGDDVVDRLLAGTATLVVKNNCLSNPEFIWVEGGSCDVIKFFRNRDGLVVTDSFLGSIVRRAQSGKYMMDNKQVSYVDLIKPASSITVLKEVPTGGAFKDATTFLAVLSMLLEPQIKNKDEGELIAGNKGNFFLVHVGGEITCVVVYWNSEGQYWICENMGFDASHWDPGNRFFFEVK